MPIHPKYLLWVVVLLAAATTLPWLGLSDFYTKGEPREACAALSVLTENRWILPHSYVDEFGFKPPMMHWLIACFSLLFGGISEAICRLPSALSMIGVAVMMFLFFQKKVPSQRAFLATLLFVSSFEVHRYALECRVDMTLAFFMVMSLFLMYRWWEKGQVGYPFWVALMLTFAALVKGPVGIFLPIACWLVFAWLKKEIFWIQFKNTLFWSLPALLVLGAWYFLAWKESGDAFIQVVFAENIGRLFGMDRDALGIRYHLGHQAPFWFYLPAFFIGLLPWSLVLLLASLKWALATKMVVIRSFFRRIKLSEMPSMTLFSMVICVVIMLFYTLSASKRSVYILPVYPFAAYLMSVFFEKAEQKFPTFVRNTVLAFLMLASVLWLALTIMHFIPVSTWFQAVPLSDKALYDLSLLDVGCANPTLTMIIGWVVLFVALCWLLAKKTMHHRMICSVLVLISVQVFLESAVYPMYKNGYSVQSVVTSLQSEFGTDEPLYAMNDLKTYRHMYGINYYVSHKLENFERSKPKIGLLLVAASDLPKIQQKYATTYRFEVLRTYKPYNELNDEILACQIVAL